MKEITRIHLASIPYNMEVEAKMALEKYLAAVQKSLAADDDAMREIEARIIELLTAHGVNGEKVITAKDVEAVKEQLGDPKDFADEEALVEEIEKTKSPKRFYKDPENKMIDGVCAGIAAYFGVDTVWIRLAFVVLLFATSGMMIPVYIVLAIIMPPARTAAQRLQMAGEPVTLSALKEESVSLATTPRGEAPFVTVLRWITGLGFAAAAIGTLAMLAVATWQTQGQIFATQSPTFIASALAMGAAGVLFALLCAVVAYALIGKRFTRRIGYLGIGIAVLGLVLFGFAVAGISLERDDLQKQFRAEQKKVSLDAEKLTGVRRIVVKSPSYIDVNYDVQKTAKPSASVSYNQRSMTGVPQVTLERHDDLLTISASYTSKDCHDILSGCGYGESLALNLSGPELSDIMVENSTVSYMTDGQNELVVDGKNSGAVTLESKGAIQRLKASLENDSRINATDANIRDVSLALFGRSSNAEFAQIANFEATIPDFCGRSQGYGAVEVEGAVKAMVNGAPYDKTADYHCTEVSIGSDVE